MSVSTAYDHLMAHTRQTMALAQAAGILDWDQETMMPADGIAQRAEQAAALGAALHARRTDPRIGEWLESIDTTALDPGAARNVALVRRSFDRATKVPERLETELARLTSAARQIWAEARAAADFKAFAPTLAQLVALKREEAACLAKDGALYDALLDDFEPGMTSDRLTPLLEGLRAPLSALREKIADASPPPALSGVFAHDAQMALSRRLGEVFGYRASAGRIDLAVHPFSSGNGGDVRITTRVDEADPLGCIYSTIHELGHAVYEQNIAGDTLLTPTGAEASMGVHESQSRMFENQIGRSRPFADWLYPEMTAAFGAFGIDNADALYAAVNRVETGFIRTEADEVHYNLHVLLRYELERDLIGGTLDVGDLEEAWNTRFERDFGLRVPDAASGVLQDIHWSQGLFGYFPTYSLGNIYAAELYARLGSDLPDADEMVAKGDLDPLRRWLTERIHSHGNAHDPVDLITRAVGHVPTAKPLTDYLETKFSALYRL